MGIYHIYQTILMNAILFVATGENCWSVLFLAVRSQGPIQTI